MIEINHTQDIQAVLQAPSVTTSTHHPADDGFTITVRYLRAQSNGDAIAIGIELAERCRNLTESRRYTVQTPLFSQLGLRRGIISREKLAEIEQLSSLSAAWQKGLAILAYGANSAHALTLKLRQRGFDAQTAEKAVDLIRSQGYLQEDHDACREAERSLDKGWGLRRIEQYLRQRGYGTDAVDAAIAAIADEDFYERCCRVARKYVKEPPSDAKQKQKIVAHLLRYGYDMEAIRHALEYAWSDENA